MTTLTTRAGQALTATVYADRFLEGYIVVVEFADQGLFSSIDLTKTPTSAGREVVINLSSTEVDLIKNSRFRVRATKSGSTSTVATGVVNYTVAKPVVVTTENIEENIPSRLSDVQLRAASVAAVDDEVDDSASHLRTKMAPIAALQPAQKLPPRFYGQQVYTTFAAGHGFTVTQGGTAGDNLNDTSMQGMGPQTVKLVTDGAGTAKRLDKTGGFTIDLTNRHPVLWVWVDDITHLQAIEVWFAASNFAQTFRLSPYNAKTTEPRLESLQPGRWVRLSFPWSASTLLNTFGTPSRAALNSIRLQVIDDNTGNPVTVRIGGVGSMPEPRSVWPNGLVSLTFDDAYASQNTAGRAKMDQYGMPGVAHIICDLVGSGGRLSVADLRNMQESSGWQVAAHAARLGSHNTVGGFTGLDDETLDEEFRLMRQWALDNGFQDGEHLAYPQGYSNDKVIAAARRFYTTARTTISRTQETWPPAEPHKMRVRNVTASTTLSTMQGWIDDAYTNAYWLNLVFHSIDDIALAGGNSLPTATFNGVIDYLAAKGIPVVTVADALAGRRMERGVTTALAPGGSNDLALDGGHAVTVGAETYSRLHASTGIPVSTGQMRLCRFTPSRDVTISNLSVATGGTVGSGLTLARLGLYTVNADGSQTLIAASLSDTTLGTVGSTVYTKPLDAGGSLPTSYTLRRGQRYAFAVLFIGTTMPNFAGIGPAAAGLAALSPVMAQQLSGQTDLPTTIANGATSASNNMIYGYLS